MIFWMAALLLVAAVAAAASPEAPDSLIQTPSGVVAAPGGHPASAQEAAAIAKRAWQDLQVTHIQLSLFIYMPKANSHFMQKNYLAIKRHVQSFDQ